MAADLLPGEVAFQGLSIIFSLKTYKLAAFISIQAVPKQLSWLLINASNTRRTDYYDTVACIIIMIIGGMV